MFGGNHSKLTHTFCIKFEISPPPKMGAISWSHPRSLWHHFTQKNGASFWMPINPFKTTTKRTGDIKVKAYGLSLTYQLWSSFEADFATHLFSPKTKKPSFTSWWLSFKPHLQTICLLFTLDHDFPQGETGWNNHHRAFTTELSGPPELLLALRVVSVVVDRCQSSRIFLDPGWRLNETVAFWRCWAQ